MNSITPITKKRHENRLRAIQHELEDVTGRLRLARGSSDLSENSEYDASLAEFSTLTTEMNKLERILTTSVTSRSNSKIIEKGSLLSINEVSESGDFIKEMGLMLFDDEGSATFFGVVSDKSPIGRTIVGGVSGRYQVADLNGTTHWYDVKIETEDRTEEYLNQYPPEIDKIVDKIFEE